MVVIGVVAVLGGCKGAEERLPGIAMRASSGASAAGANVVALRATAAAELLRAFRDGMKFGDAIDAAYDRLDSDPNATVFAGGVLDAIEQAGEAVGTGGEFEFFWMKVGRLACKSADVAMASSRLAEARALVLAGSRRWQHENYWSRYPDHDALAAAILAAAGERDEAVRRLRSRDELGSPAKEVLEQLLRGPPKP